MKWLQALFLIHITFLVCAQSELELYYAYYKVDQQLKGKCDSIFNLIEKRRSDFSKVYRAYKLEHGHLIGFSYDWGEIANSIESSLRTEPIEKAIRDLIYYSYFDIGYGAYGYEPKSEFSIKAMKIIEPSSIIWSLEPSLLDAIIKVSGGEDDNRDFLTRLTSENKNAPLAKYISNNFDPRRPIKRGNAFPDVKFQSLEDTSTILSVMKNNGKYVLIDVWATWCKPCLEEHPNLLKAFNNRPDNLEFVSVSIDNNMSTLVNFFTNTGNIIPWENGLAVERRTLLNRLKVSGIPLTLLVSPKGEILAYGNDLRGGKLEVTITDLTRSKNSK